jgi:hypothetical protein
VAIPTAIGPATTPRKAFAGGAKDDAQPQRTGKHRKRVFACLGVDVELAFRLLDRGIRLVFSGVTQLGDVVPHPSLDAFDV